MLLAVLIFVATIALVIWQPKGLGIGWSAMNEAIVWDLIPAPSARSATILFWKARPTTARPSASATRATACSMVDLPAPAMPWIATVLSSEERISAAAPSWPALSSLSATAWSRPGASCAARMAEASPLPSSTAPRIRSSVRRASRVVTIRGRVSRRSGPSSCGAAPCRPGGVRRQSRGGGREG